MVTTDSTRSGGFTEVKSCLSRSPSKGGLNYGGNVVKKALIKKLVSSEVYCSKLHQLNVVNKERLRAKQDVWDV